jgi:hypothetical protein
MKLKSFNFKEWNKNKKQKVYTIEENREVIGLKVIKYNLFNPILLGAIIGDTSLYSFSWSLEGYTICGPVYHPFNLMLEDKS